MDFHGVCSARAWTRSWTLISVFLDIIPGITRNGLDAKADVNFTYKICYFYNVAVEFFVEMGSKMSFNVKFSVLIMCSV